MSPDYVVELMKGLMAHIMMIALPLLVTGMTVGLMVSLFQAVTSLQEQTLTFVPKALAVSTLQMGINMNEITPAIKQPRPTILPQSGEGRKHKVP